MGLLRLAAPILASASLLGPTGAMGQADCSGGQFSGTEAYSVNDRLPFDFEHPLGWETQTTSFGHETAIIGKPRGQMASGAVPVTMDILVALQPDPNHQSTLALWRQTMDLVATVPYGNGMIEIFSPSWAVQARFLVPASGGQYSVTVNLNNGDTCPPEATALRQLLIDTLTPNTNTTFPNP
jgi:hypothetical protein